MAILKIETFEVQVSDYIETKISIILDLHFNSHDQLDSFYDFYQKSLFKRFTYSCAGVERNGYLGVFIYDHDCNARLYITDEANKSFSQPDVRIYNLVPLLHNFEKRISTIMNVLCDKGLISKEEATQLSSYLYPCDEKMDLDHQVENVHQYLADTGSTMQETRKFFNPEKMDSGQ